MPGYTKETSPEYGRNGRRRNATTSNSQRNSILHDLVEEVANAERFIAEISSTSHRVRQYLENYAYNNPFVQSNYRAVPIYNVANHQAPGYWFYEYNQGLWEENWVVSADNFAPRLFGPDNLTSYLVGKFDAIISLAIPLAEPLNHRFYTPQYVYPEQASHIGAVGRFFNPQDAVFEPFGANCTIYANAAGWSNPAGAFYPPRQESYPQVTGVLNVPQPQATHNRCYVCNFLSDILSTTVTSRHPGLASRTPSNPCPPLLPGDVQGYPDISPPTCSGPASSTMGASNEPQNGSASPTPAAAAAAAAPNNASPSSFPPPCSHINQQQNPAGAADSGRVDNQILFSRPFSNQHSSNSTISRAIPTIPIRMRHVLNMHRINHLLQESLDLIRAAIQHLRLAYYFFQSAVRLVVSGNPLLYAGAQEIFNLACEYVREALGKIRSAAHNVRMAV